MTPRYAVGDAIRVGDRREPGHVRTPGYLMGREGRILRICGAFPDPGRLAEGGLGLPYRMLYRVAFRQRDLWPDYGGPDADDLVTDLYEHWLEPRDRTP